MKAEIYWNKSKLLFIGASGMGKTSFLIQYLKGCQKIKGFSCIALDSNFEYSTRLNLKPLRNIIDVRPNTALQSVDTDIKALNNFIMMCRRYTNQLIILEDIDLFLAGTGAPPEQLKNLMVNGRHQGLGFCATSKRLVGLPKLILQQADYITIFRCGPFTQKDFDNYKDVIPNLEDIKTLTPHEYILYRVDNQTALPLTRSKTVPI